MYSNLVMAKNTISLSANNFLNSLSTPVDMSLHQLCAVRLLRKYQVVHTALLECSVRLH
jgi:hypothetical protein